MSSEATTVHKLLGLSIAPTRDLKPTELKTLIDKFKKGLCLLVIDEFSMVSRYLMGIGSLREISLAVANGFDIFDCVLPTRLGRHGTAFFNDERLNLRNARFKNDFSPIDKTCKCETCKSYSRAYLHHLIRNDEILGLTLISLHNIAHLIRFTNAISTAIRDNCFTNDFAPWKTSSIAHHTW